MVEIGDHINSVITSPSVILVAPSINSFNKISGTSFEVGTSYELGTHFLVGTSSFQVCTSFEVGTSFIVCKYFKICTSFKFGNRYNNTANVYIYRLTVT